MTRDLFPEIEYRAVEGYPRYRVGSDGTLWARQKDSWRRLAGSIDRDGYTRVELWRDGRARRIGLAVLILETFAGPNPGGMVCCHNNGNPRDDRPDNLRWDTQKGNVADTLAHGTRNTGRRNGRAKLTEDDVRAIRRLRFDGAELAEIASRFGVSFSVVSSVCRRRTWSHVDGGTT